MIAGFQDPLRALLFTLGGAFLAWLWVEVSRTAAAGVAVVVFMFALGLAAYGKSIVTEHPKWALGLMESRLVSIGVLTATTGALGIVITVELATDATGYQKQIVTVVSGALVAFVTGVTYTADKVDAAVGKYIKTAFQAAYVREGQPAARNAPKRTRPLPAGSVGERVLGSQYASGLTDWSRESRHKRIDLLVAYLDEERKGKAAKSGSTV